MNRMVLLTSLIGSCLMLAGCGTKDVEQAPDVAEVADVESEVSSEEEPEDEVVEMPLLGISIDSFVEDVNSRLELTDFSYRIPEPTEHEGRLIAQIDEHVSVSFTVTETGEIYVVTVTGSSDNAEDFAATITQLINTTIASVVPDVNATQAPEIYNQLIINAEDNGLLGQSTINGVELALMVISGDRSSVVFSASGEGYLEYEVQADQRRKAAMVVPKPDSFIAMATLEDLVVSLGQPEWIEDDTVIRVTIHVQNNGEFTSFDLAAHKIYGPDQQEIENLHLQYDDSLSYAASIDPGDELTRYLYFPYEGDGEYAFAFGRIIKESIGFEVAKEEDGIDVDKVDTDSSSMLRGIDPDKYLSLFLSKMDERGHSLETGAATTPEYTKDENTMMSILPSAAYITFTLDDLGHIDMVFALIQINDKPDRALSMIYAMIELANQDIGEYELSQIASDITTLANESDDKKAAVLMQSGIIYSLRVETANTFGFMITLDK